MILEKGKISAHTVQTGSRIKTQHVRGDDGKIVTINPLSSQKHGFLQFSQKLDYGLFLLTELAKNENGLIPSEDSKRSSINSTQTLPVFSREPISLRSITEKNSMSFFFMQKVAFILRRSGIINAGRGKNGGYLLAKPSSSITLKEIIEVLEGPVMLTNCLLPRLGVDAGSGSLGNAICSREAKCHMRHGISTINQAIVNIFSQTTLHHLLYPTTWKPNL